MRSPIVTCAAAETSGPGGEPQPPSYDVRHSAAAHERLLAGDTAAWTAALRVSWGPALYPTAFRALWNARGLYVRFDATDPAPWWTMTARDAHLWEEEVVEIFLDPARQGRNYAELEISPANVVCDVLMREAWPHQQSDLSWDIAGLETAVVPMAGGEGWTALACLPWPPFATLPGADGVTLPPAAGDSWHFNVFRIKRPGGPSAPDAGLVLAAWSPPRGRSFHDAQAFRPFVFQR